MKAAGLESVDIYFGRNLALWRVKQIVNDNEEGARNDLVSELVPSGGN